MADPKAVKCLACSSEFEPIIILNENNRRFINCYVCGRSYKYDEQKNTWFCDRQLTILDKLTEANVNTDFCEYSMPAKIKINDTDRLCFLTSIHTKCDCKKEDCVIRYYAIKRKQSLHKEGMQQ